MTIDFFPNLCYNINVIKRADKLKNREKELSIMKNEKFWEFINYLCLAGLIIGQITIGFMFYVGQTVYLITDILILIRVFACKYPLSEKVKNVALTAICLGVLVVKIFC